MWGWGLCEPNKKKKKKKVEERCVGGLKRNNIDELNYSENIISEKIKNQSSN